MTSTAEEMGAVAEHTPMPRSGESGLDGRDRQRTAIPALGLLDELDEFRRRHQNSTLHPSDWCMRVIEAIVARAFGYETRNSWTELLDADPQSRYYRAFHPSAVEAGTFPSKTPEKKREDGRL